MSSLVHTRKSGKESMGAEKEARRRYLRPVTGYFFSLTLFAAASLWIRSGFPVFVIGNSPHDDQLFIRLAYYVSAGNWLGPYDKFTLAKGMVYSIFISIAHFCSVPLKIAEQIVYLAACVLTAEFVRRKTTNFYFAAILFALLAFNPVVWSSSLARVLREGLYLGFSLSMVVLFVMVAFPDSKKGHFTSLTRAACAVSLGLVGVAYWLTREEGVWLVPSLGVVVLFGVARMLWPDSGPSEKERDHPKRSAQIKAVTWPIILTVLTFMAGDFLMAGLNYQHYGIFETNEFRAKSFLRAYGALTRIRPDHWQHYVLFPQDARARAYAVSSAARELKPGFEGPTAEGWRNASCKTIQVDPCTEVLAGWLVWQLRDSVDLAGHYKSAPEAMYFYDALADQINAACASGSIQCLPRRDTFSPAFRPEYLSSMMQSGLTLVKTLFTLRDGPLGTPPSTGSRQQISMFEEMVGSVSQPKVRQRVLTGWIAASSGTPTLRLVSSGPEQFQTSIAMLPAQDVVAQYPNLKVVRFQLETNCPLLLCALIVQSPEARPAVISLAELTQSPSFKSPFVLLNVDSFATKETAPPWSDDQSAKVQIANVISSGYAIVLPILIAFGVCGLLLALSCYNARVIPTEILALGLASLAAVGFRIAILSYITATSFPAAMLLYASPASSFVIIFAAIGTYCGWLTLLNRYRPPLAPAR